MYNFSGRENGIYWKVTPLGDRLFNISAKNTISDKTSNEDYTCQYPIVFGFDAVDNNNIENLIDKMIRSVS